MRRILADEEVAKKGFWRRQFDSVPTGGQEMFDGIFGVILPVLCFVADPIVFKGGFFEDSAFLGDYRVLAYLTSAIEIAVFIVWRTFRKQVSTFSAPFAGVLFAGGIFSTVIGIVILPLTLFGLLLLIGILGFIPFLTGFVYFRSGVRAMKDQVRNSTFEFRFLTAALAGLLVIFVSVSGTNLLQPLMPITDREHRLFDDTWDGD